MSAAGKRLVKTVLDQNPEMDPEDARVQAWEQCEGDRQKRAALAKSAPSGSVSKMEFEITTEGSVGAICKADDDFVVWGPASVEVVDKENDRITAKALEGALPQLLKRSRLSYEHSDQIVGDILKSFETEESQTVKVNGNSYERSEFPTDVMKLDGMEPALYVAGNIYNDTQKAQEVRKQISNGEVDSYSISGEAVVSEMAVKDGRTFTDITKLDLSAVTLCREGMNQKAKFDVVRKDGDGLDPQRAASLAKSKIKDKTMSNGDNGDDSDVQKFVDALDTTLDERLPDGELATKGDVEEMVEDKLKAQEGSPKEGTPERPTGDDKSPFETDEDHEGDVDDWGENPADDSDKVEEKNAYTKDELKSILPDDQYKAVEPLLEDDDPDVDPRDEAPEEEINPEPEPEVPPEGPDEDPLGEGKSAADLDFDRLSGDQIKALAKSGALSKAEGTSGTRSGVGSGAQPAHAGSDEGQNGPVAKADSDAVASDPAMRNIYGSDGQPQI